MTRSGWRSGFERRSPHLKIIFSGKGIKLHPMDQKEKTVASGQDSAVLKEGGENNWETQSEASTAATEMPQAASSPKRGRGRPRKEGFILKEKVALDRAMRVLRSNALSANQYHSLSSMMNIAIKGGGYLEVEYTIDEGRYGRLKSEVVAARKTGFIYHSTTMVREMRNAIYAKDYHDVDMENAHLRIASQLFKANDIAHPLLIEFIKKRKTLIKNISSSLQVSHGDVKTLFISLSYGGGFKAWCEKLKLTEETLFKASEPYDIQGFKKEYTNAVTTLLALPKYEYIMVFAIQRRKEKLEAKQPVNTNVSFSAMAYLLQDIERITIIALMTHLNEQSRMVSGYAYDGLMVEKLYEDEVLSKEMLQSWNEAVYQSTGYRVRLCAKEMEVHNHWLPVVTTVNNDEEAAQAFLLAYGDRLKKSGNRMFVKLDSGIWSWNDSEVASTMMGMSMNMNIFMLTQTMKGDTQSKPYSKNVDGARKIRTAVEALIKPDPEFVSELWTSNLGYLVYQNGIYDVRNKCVVPASEAHKVASTILINRDIPKRNEALMAEVEEKLWRRLLPKDDERAYCKTLMARGLAGEIRDKRYGVFRGERNCGKGVTTEALKAAFGDYIGSTNSENFLFKGKNSGSDQAKNQSWMIMHEFTRLVITQEIQIDENDPSVKINGNMVKRFVSGGDVLQARVNYKDETDFKVQARLIMFMNDLPKFSPTDAMETMDYFDFPNRFVSAEDKAHPGNVNDPTVFVADGDIKDWLRQYEVADAFAWTILDAYGDYPSVPDSIRRGKEDLMEGLRETDQMDDIFEITRLDTDRMSNDQIERHTKDVNMSMLRKKRYLMRKGASAFRAPGRRGLSGLKLRVVPMEDW